VAEVVVELAMRNLVVELAIRVRKSLTVQLAVLMVIRNFVTSFTDHGLWLNLHSFK
jgi:hypothetical protein